MRCRSLLVVRSLVLLALLSLAAILLGDSIAEAHGAPPAASVEAVGFIHVVSSETVSVAVALRSDRIGLCPNEDSDGGCCAGGACHAVGSLVVWAPNSVAKAPSDVPEHRPFPEWSLIHGMLRPPRP